MYKVHFRLKDEEYELVAASLDLSHPYFVSIKDMELSYEDGLVVNPHLENTKKRFKDIQSIMIPFQNVALIETFQPREKQSENASKVRKIRAVNDDEK